MIAPMVQKIAILILIVIYFTGCEQATDRTAGSGKSIFSVWKSPNASLDLRGGYWVAESRYDAENDRVYTVYTVDMQAQASFGATSCALTVHIESSQKTDGIMYFDNSTPECLDVFADGAKYSHFSNHQYFGTSLHISGLELEPTEIFQ